MSKQKRDTQQETGDTLPRANHRPLFEEALMDAKLRISSGGRNDDFSDDFRYPYEPTDYAVLKRIGESGLVGKDDVLLDYGSGKGRVPIYMNYVAGCSAIGIEMIDSFVAKANENLQSYGGTQEISFVNDAAENYMVPKKVTCCFFFNPFSVEILRRVMKNLIESYYENPRTIRLFFYYPQDEYIAYLMTVNELEFVDEIDCMDLFEKRDDRNRVMIFEMI